MKPGSIVRRVAAIAFFWSVTWVFLAAVWLLYVDNYYLPELITGAVAAAIGATGSELVRAQRITRVRLRPRWLMHAWRPLARAPLDVAVVSVAIVRQCVERRPKRGRLRAVRFEHGGDDPGHNARRVLAEALGSFAPNTIVIGVDPEQDLILAHQLDPAAGDPVKSIDSMELR